jgi:thiomorpholine-carboxylate dehydrogenase
MPAVYGGVMGAKMVTFYPGNVALGKHTHMAMIELFRSDTGEPLAVMDGRLITEMRTAAVSAVAVDCLARRDAKVLGILGSGCGRGRVRALAGADLTIYGFGADGGECRNLQRSRAGNGRRQCRARTLC